MNRPNITPGQWRYREFGPISTAKGNVRYIAQICTHGEFDRRNEEDEANAQAIAAVPSMLEVLEKLALVGSMEPETIHDAQVQRYCATFSAMAVDALIKAGYTF